MSAIAPAATAIGFQSQTTVSAASPTKVEIAFGLPGMTLHEDQQCRLHTGHDTERGAGAGIVAFAHRIIGRNQVERGGTATGMSSL